MRSVILAIVAILSITQVSEAQLLRRFRKNPLGVDSSCPNGFCPNVNTRATGHWTHPGTIGQHMATAHGTDTSGMTREEALSLHDAIHEGRAPNNISKTLLPVGPTIIPVVQSTPTVIPTYALSAYATAPIVVKSGGSSGSVKAGSWTYSHGSTGSTVKFYDAKGTLLGTATEQKTSAGSTISPEIAGIQQLNIGDRVKFRRNLLEAARNARQAGDITPAQYFLLSAASRSPIVLDQIQAAVHEAAIEEGLATPQAVDWDALLAFIEKLIPIIIQLIDLFS